AETLEALACLGDQQEGDPEGLSLSAGGQYHRWLQIEGNSGSGKSSLMQAGMLPMIEQGALWARTGFEHWTLIGPMMPGRDPLAMLAEKLAQAFGDEMAELRTRKQDGVAFLLVVDQFEELFTLAEDQPRRRFDALLAHALQDPDCPLFVVSTVRADFLDRFEALPRLQAIYNSHCRRYFLPTISGGGLRDCIEQPARLAGLNVDEVLVPLLDQARDEEGALPLVENALFVLWNNRAGNRLSGQYLQDAGGLAGMLSSQADALLARIERELGAKKGRKGALELLLRLTRINDQGRHTRRRISREEAVTVAGAGRDKVGERIVQLLSGERRADAPGGSGVQRLVTVTAEQELDLIHETLIRTRGKDTQTGKPLGYWPALHDYIEANRDRDLQRQQLALQATRWRDSGGFGRWQNRAGLRDLARFRRVPLARGSLEARFLRWSGRIAWLERGLLLVLLGAIGILLEGLWWANRNKLPPSYALHQALWMLGRWPVPEFVEIAPGSFTMGCKPGRDDVGGARCIEFDRAHPVTLTRPYALGRYEVSFLEYDYFVWDMKRKGKGENIVYPPDANWGREDRPVIYVNWFDAKGYAAWLSERLGLHGAEVIRLPTEAEWEFAARAGTDTPYWWNWDFDRDKAICGLSYGDRTLPIGDGIARENPWGLQDMLGNVYEWTEDWYATYRETDGPDPVGPPAGRSRVLRGGSWYNDPRFCRAAFRFNYPPDFGDRFFGFRVCRGYPIDSLATAPPDAGAPKR
ncbi:MAG: formylglycine-generating enzyme family protein, partial [Xanthomonadales bacterium]|nr:formylglycine-generating enzyme family protein [Xanthomonadales bacterium]